MDPLQHARRGARRGATVLLAFALALGLGACGGGGGGGGGAPVATAPPAAIQAPAITAQPAAQGVSAGASATFTVAASGDGLSYQWQRDGKDIAGASGASYTLANAQAADNGASFTVIVKNAGGSVTSAPAVLKVTPPPSSAAGPLALLAGPLGGSGNLDGPVGRFNRPSNLAASPAGTLYVRDDAPFPALRVITQAPGQDAVVTTLPPQQDAIIGAVDAAGNLYENTGYQIFKRTPAGVRTFVAGNANVNDTVFKSITSMAVDAAGTLYVADGPDHTIRKVTPQGVVTTLAGSSGQAGTADGTGAEARFTGPGKLVIDNAGNLVVSDGTVVRRITLDGVVTTVAGVRADSPAATDDNPAWFAQIDGLGTDAAGNIYVLSGNLRRVSPRGAVSDFTSPLQGFPRVPPLGDYPSMAQDGAGNLYIASTNPPLVRRVTLAGEVSVIAGKAPQTGSTDGNGAAARFLSSSAAAPASSLYADAQGNVFVAEGPQVRKITRAGDVSTLALPATGPGNWTANYFTSGYVGGALLVYANGMLSRVDANGATRFLAGQALPLLGMAKLVDGVGANASFANARGFVSDAQGNVYCLDQVPPRFTDDPIQTFVIRKITPDGTVTTLPVAGFGGASSWFVDRDGRLVMAAGLGAVLRLEADNSLSTLRAPLASAQLGATVQSVVAGDRDGNLYVADFVRNEDTEGVVLHKITPAGADSIIAGRRDMVGVRLGAAPGVLNVVGALAVGADGAVYLMSENSVLRLAP